MVPKNSVELLLEKLRAVEEEDAKALSLLRSMTTHNKYLKHVQENSVPQGLMRFSELKGKVVYKIVEYLSSIMVQLDESSCAYVNLMEQLTSRWKVLREEGVSMNVSIQFGDELIRALSRRIDLLKGLEQGDPHKMMEYAASLLIIWESDDGIKGFSEQFSTPVQDKIDSLGTIK